LYFPVGDTPSNIDSGTGSVDGGDDAESDTADDAEDAGAAEDVGPDDTAVGDTPADIGDTPEDVADAADVAEPEDVPDPEDVSDVEADAPQPDVEEDAPDVEEDAPDVEEDAPDVEEDAPDTGLSISPDERAAIESYCLVLEECTSDIPEDCPGELEDYLLVAAEAYGADCFDAYIELMDCADELDCDGGYLDFDSGCALESEAIYAACAED
jgi:hypothetical protein